jgi:hypothetical protein
LAVAFLAFPVVLKRRSTLALLHVKRSHGVRGYPLKRYPLHLPPLWVPAVLSRFLTI